MQLIKEQYTKKQTLVQNIIFALILTVYPLVKINQGIDVSDTTYSLANFQYFPSMDGTWIVATYLANAAGYLLTKLPFGETLLGMNFYTALVQSGIAVTAYFALCRRIPAPLVFVGELMALGLMFCPSVILYNYLTYLLMTAGALLLYEGILKENKKLYLAAGVCLGANVAVRMPNVVQMAFIVAVWYGVAVKVQNGAKEDRAGAQKKALWKTTVEKCCRDTLWCLSGYLIGFGIPFAAICLRYGVTAYPAMVRTMFAMTDQASDYKPTAMLTGMFGDYMRGLYWLLFAGACIAAGLLLFRVQRKLFLENRAVEMLCKAGYVAALLLLLRFYWGRGMFHFRYYDADYGSMYYPAVLLLVVTLAAAVYCLAKRDVRLEQKVMAVLVLVQIFVTPLGSNNRLYPIINNLFIAVPFLLWIASGWITGKRVSFAVKAPLVTLGIFVLIQSIGFHFVFAFQDGIWGEARDVLIAHPAKVSGVYTNRDNGESLEKLAVYAEKAGLAGQEVILYGEIPGIGYLLDMPSALSTFWPDLDSYRMEEYERDLTRIETENISRSADYPAVIVSAGVAAYISGDGEAMAWFGVDEEALKADAKLGMLMDFMRRYGYAQIFGNARYAVYLAE